MHDDDVNIIIGDYTLFKYIGKGAYGKVYLTIKKNSSDLFATKMIDLQNEKLKKMNKYLDNEIKIMELLNHPNIIKLYETIRLNNRLYLIMEFCNGGNLLDLLYKYKKKYREPFSIKIIQYFMRQIIKGIEYIHSLSIIHRDIKLSNILIKFPNVIRKNNSEFIDINDLDESDFLSSELKIIDFGLSKKLDPNELAQTALGTPFHMAPQILEKFKKAGGLEKLEGYTQKADIWSLGTIFYQMLTGEQLFNVNSIYEIMEKLDKGEYSIPIDLELSKETISFLSSMLQYNEEIRASAKDLLEHEFFSKDLINFTKVEFEEIPDKIDIIYLIIDNLHNNKQLRKRINKNQNPEILEKYINCLLDDYKAAKKYFKTNNLIEQEKDAYNKCLEIEKIKQILNKGNKINLTILPKPIKPEYIYGSSKIERNNKFKEILYKYREEKNKLEVKIKSFEKQSINKTNKDENDKNKIKYEKLKKIIEYFENQFKNIWVPAPQYTKEMKLIANEKINYKNCEFKIKMQIKRIDDLKEKLSLIITFLVNEDKTLKKEVELNANNNFYEEWIWILNDSEWMNADNNSDNFILGIETGHHFFSSNIQKSYLYISKIKNGKELTFEHNLQNSSKTNKISITAIPILPLGEKTYTNELKEYISINKVYPTFVFNSSSVAIGPESININFKNS